MLSRNAACELRGHTLAFVFIAAGLQAETLSVRCGRSRLLPCCLFGAPPKRGHASNMQCQRRQLHGLCGQQLSWCNGRTGQTSLACWAGERQVRRRPQSVRPAWAAKPAPRAGAAGRRLLTEATHRPLSERHRRSRPSRKDRPVLSLLVAQHPHPPTHKETTRNAWHKFLSALRMFLSNISQWHA